MKILSLLILSALAGCAASPDAIPKTQLRVWVAADMNSEIVGKNPAANVLVTQPLTQYIEAHFHHMSSLAEKDDPGIVDSVGVGVCIRFPVRPCL